MSKEVKRYNPLIVLARNAKLQRMDIRCDPQWVLDLAAERDALLAELDTLKADLERAHRATNSECMDWAREYERRREVQAERDQIRAEVERLREAELLLLSVCDDLMRHENADVRMVTCIELNNWLTRRAALQGEQP